MNEVKKSDRVPPLKLKFNLKFKEKMAIDASNDDEGWMYNHLSLGKDDLSNPLDPLPPALKNIEGINQLKSKLGKKLADPTSFRDKSSELPYLFSMVKCIWPMDNNSGEGEENRYNEYLPRCPSAILKGFFYSQRTPSSSRKRGRLQVHIVSSDKRKWYRVSCLNPKSVALVAAGEGNYGTKSIFDHARDYLQCAEENPFLFKAPQIAFIFTSGVAEQVAEELESMGVEVIGRRIKDEELDILPRIKVLEECEVKALQKTTIENEIQPSPSLDELSLEEGVKKLNLDISALTTYVSNLTNGHSHVRFKGKVLEELAEAERARPQKPILDAIFEGRELYCCETVHSEFQTILSASGGEEEKRRAAQFISERVTIIPDQVSERAKAFNVPPKFGNLKRRNSIMTIFGTGKAIEAFTVTSNSAFVRSAKSQGVEFPSFIHEPRPLTERKQCPPCVNETQYLSISQLRFRKSDHWMTLVNQLSVEKDGILSNPLDEMPEDLKNIKGIGKLRKMLDRELESSISVRDTKSYALPYLLSMVKCIWPMEKGEGSNRYNDIFPQCPSAVFRNFSRGKVEPNENRTLVVDIVSADGSKWYKVTTTDPITLVLTAVGKGGSRNRSILEQALDYLKCAKEHPCPSSGEPSQIAFVFMGGITEYVATKLEYLNVEVIGRRIEDEALEVHPSIKALKESKICQNH